MLVGYCYKWDGANGLFFARMIINGDDGLTIKILVNDNIINSNCESL